MFDYPRLVWYYLTQYDVERDGGQFKLTGWQHICVTDGPIHTLWCWWGILTCNWFTIAFHCARHGHDWRDEFITWAPERKFTLTNPGKYEKTGHTLKWKIRVCTYCGNYRGKSSEVVGG